MICLRYSKKDLSAKSEIFVNPDFFEYFIDRKKTKNPRQPLPDNKNLATMAKAAKNGWVGIKFNGKTGYVKTDYVDQ